MNQHPSAAMNANNNDASSGWPGYSTLFPRPVSSLLILTLVLVTSIASAAPRLSYVYPIGYQRGQKITLLIVGQDLAGDIEVQSKIPGTFTLKPVDMVDGKPAYNEDQRRDIELQIAPDAPVGLYPVRVRTPDGVSNHVLFSVGSLPDVGEVEPNNTPEQPQVVNLGTTILGSVAPADRDVYKLTLPAGTRLVAEVEARRINMPMDSALAVLDAQGRELASSDDAQGLDADSRLDVTLPRAGDYFVVINDVNYQQSSSYRLKIGSYDYAEAIFPLGAPKAESANVWAWSRATGEQQLVVNTAASERWTMVRPMGDASPALPFRFVVSTGPEIVETAGQVPEIADGQTANGRIAAPGEKDLFKLVTTPGQRWRFSTSAKKLGSSLDAVLSVESTDGKSIVRSVDQVDPVFDFVTPENVSEIRLAVEDLHGRGGPSFGYRLFVQKLAADFSLELQTDVVNIPVGSAEYVPVRVDRRGYDGPIQLFVPESITGIVGEGGLIPAGQNDGYLLLSAQPGIAPVSTTLEIWGRGGTPTRPMDRRVLGNPASASPFVAANLFDPIPAAIARPKPFTVTPAAREVTVVSGFGGNVVLNAVRSDAVTEDIRLEAKNVPPSLPQGMTLTIAKGQSAGTLGIPGGVEYGLPQGIVLFDAISKVAGKDVRASLPPIFVRFVRPFAVEFFRRDFTLPPTGQGNIELVIRRQSVFNREVIVQLEGLPKGITAEPVTVPGDRQSVAIPVTTAEVAAGTYPVKVRVSADLDGRKQQKTYDLPLEDVQLIVAPPPQ